MLLCVCAQFVVLCVYDFQLVLVSTISIVFLALAMDFYSPKVFSASTRLNRAVSAFQLHAQARACVAAPAATQITGSKILGASIVPSRITQKRASQVHTTHKA